MALILVADDDAHLREVVRFALVRAGHTVELACDGVAALARAGRAPAPELVVLDVLMPELDGLAVCRELRGRVPVVMLSSRGEELDRVLGLELGADDYLAKPFSPRELVARVTAVLRRGAATTAAVAAPRAPLAIGTAVVVDRDRHEVRVSGSALAVTATELRLLAALAEHPGRVLSRVQLIAAAYGDDHHITERTIDTHIRNLRSKLASAGAPVIETVHGVGYRCG
jgi:two-component system OmpR family response regulator|nr:response regulator transcription factor [Kofleriaceae bacterium]